MAERKVLTKYFPPDFDPSKIKRVKRDVNKQQVVRLMAPFNMACKSCGEYIYKGRKFNARKEVVIGQEYYGIKIFRFYIKCTRCSSEITFKTDPKNTDYEMEHGATRNHEYWKDYEARKRKEEDPLAHFAEEERLREGLDDDDHDQDPMTSLEARQEESKREMEVLDELQDLRTRNAKLDRVDTLQVLERKRKRDEQEQPSIEDLELARAQEEDEQLVQKYFAHQGKQVVKRSALEKEPEPLTLLSERARALLGGGSAEGTGKQDLQPPVSTAASTAAPSSHAMPSPHITSSPSASKTTAAKTTTSAAMAGMAGMAAKKNKDKKKANALGLVRKAK